MNTASNTAREQGSDCLRQIPALSDLATSRPQFETRRLPGPGRGAPDCAANLNGWRQFDLPWPDECFLGTKTPCTAHRIDQPSPNFGRSAEQPSLTGSFAYPSGPERDFRTAFPCFGGGMLFYPPTAGHPLSSMECADLAEAKTCLRCSQSVRRKVMAECPKRRMKKTERSADATEHRLLKIAVGVD